MSSFCKRQQHMLQIQMTFERAQHSPVHCLPAAAQQGKEPARFYQGLLVAAWTFQVQEASK